ncbi:hypothetical protein D3C77_469950 [compost metagenome]
MIHSMENGSLKWLHLLTLVAGSREPPNLKARPRPKPRDIPPINAANRGCPVIAGSGCITTENIENTSNPVTAHMAKEASRCFLCSTMNGMFSSNKNSPNFISVYNANNAESPVIPPTTIPCGIKNSSSPMEARRAPIMTPITCINVLLEREFERRILSTSAKSVNLLFRIARREA